jgi:enterochelin esterase family protein
MSRTAALLVLATTVSVPATLRGQSAPGTLVSPEVHPDRRITFRLQAPRASEVAVAGEWTQPTPNAPVKMTRDPKGVWSLTVGPVEPNIYIYVFNVDGTTIVDPVNPLVKLRARTAASMVEVPGGEPWDFRDVPHGQLHTHTHAAASLGGAQRQFVVYTPPGYERGRARYPLLYLLHGNNDLAVGWTMAGRANLILDNQIADKRTVPMVVVMPYGHALPFGTRPPQGQPDLAFERYLLEDVAPLVEAHYRLAPGRRHRGIVGLSMGGGHATQIALRHRDRFAWVGSFGAGLTREDFEARYRAVLPVATEAAAAARSRPPFSLFFVGTGRQDGVLARAKALSEALKANGVPATYFEIDGGHTYPVWRKLLVQAAPLLFR